jgi:hypothetical protein
MEARSATVTTWRTCDLLSTRRTTATQRAVFRIQIVAPTQSRGGAQAGAAADDMAITAFPALAPRLRSVAYPDNFKPNI